MTRIGVILRPLLLLMLMATCSSELNLTSTLHSFLRSLRDGLERVWRWHFGKMSEVVSLRDGRWPCFGMSQGICEWPGCDSLKGRSRRRPNFEGRTAAVVFWHVIVVVGIASQASGQSTSPQEVARQRAFFESRIRPVLIEHCYPCHSVETDRQGGLWLDSRESGRAGGDSGSAIVPGNPEASLLVKAIRYDDLHLQMPPDGKLSERMIDDLVKWIAEGAFDDREVEEGSRTTRSSALPVERAMEHWAYRPVASHAVPETEHGVSASTTIDAWIDSALREKGLVPHGQADRRTLLRRLVYDLHGLLPDEAMLRTFEADTAPDAYARWVDRLLASPRYGERMARHWLDLVRYAESVTLRGLTQPNAWRYRDYLIVRWNADVPLDVMLREHLAGDLLAAEGSSLPVDERQWQMTALSFLTLGNTNLEEQDKQQLEMDVVDEQIDTLGRAFLGQTLGCARCHDHKFDPIPTRDYYALAGILKSGQTLQHENVSKWVETALPLATEEAAHFAKVKSELEGAKRELQKVRERLGGGGVMASIPLAEVSGTVVDDAVAKKIGVWQDSTSVKPYVGQGYCHDQDGEKGAKTITFEPQGLAAGVYEVRLAYTPGENRAERVPVTVASAEGEQTLEINQRKKPEQGPWVVLGRFRFEANGQAYVVVSNEGTRGHVVADAVQFLSIDELGKAAPLGMANQDGWREEEKRWQGEVTRKEQELAEAPRVMGLMQGVATDLAIHRRGSVHLLGEKVARGVPSAFLPKAPAIVGDASGRRELAEWIASSENPLTTRVMANRIWCWIMGQGIVGSVDNFGTTGELPTHPELLDYLAQRLVEQGWSMKSLVREIVMSEAYRRESRGEPGIAEEVDPGNRGYWRGVGKRLDAEGLRDAMLAVSGELDLRMYGRRWSSSVQADYDFVFDESCRSVYAPVFRNAIPDLFQAFDFANPSLGVGMRTPSTIVQQSLFLMHSPWVWERAKKLSTRFAGGDDASNRELVVRAFRQVLHREPRSEELDYVLGAFGLGDEVVCRDGETWASVFHMLLCSLDFRYLD